MHMATTKQGLSQGNKSSVHNAAGGTKRNSCSVFLFQDLLSYIGLIRQAKYNAAGGTKRNSCSVFYLIKDLYKIILMSNILLYNILSNTFSRLLIFTIIFRSSQIGQAQRCWGYNAPQLCRDVIRCRGALTVTLYQYFKSVLYMSPIHYSLQCGMYFVSPYSAQSQWGQIYKNKNLYIVYSYSGAPAREARQRSTIGNKIW